MEQTTLGVSDTINSLNDEFTMTSWMFNSLFILLDHVCIYKVPKDGILVEMCFYYMYNSCVL